MTTVRQMQPRTTSPVPQKALAGKVALITGSSSGIGEAIALEMGQQGASVVVNYIGASDAAEQVVSSIAESDAEAIAIHADVSKQADVAAMISQTIQKWGHIDVLVNNAGIEHESPFLEKSEAEWDKVIAVNLKGAFLCTQIAAREMAKKKRGTIINISSVHEDLLSERKRELCHNQVYFERV